MKQRPRIYYTERQKALMWERWQKGESRINAARPILHWHPCAFSRPRNGCADNLPIVLQFISAFCGACDVWITRDVRDGRMRAPLTMQKTSALVRAFRAR
jgi:hypothetical protein